MLTYLDRIHKQPGRQADRQTYGDFLKLRMPANHPFIDGFSIVNLPFGVTPLTMETSKWIFP